MPVDYAEALRDLDAQIAYHETQIEMLKSARPGFVALRNALAGGFRAPSVNAGGRFSGMGNQAAVRALMGDGQLRTRDEIYRDLKAGGFTSDAKDPAGSIGATLSQMKDEMERVEDRWRKKTSQARLVDTVERAPVTEEPVFVSPGAPDSFARAIYDHPGSIAAAKP